MSGSTFNSTPLTFNGEPAPFSDVIIPPSDYNSAYLQPTSSRPNSSTSRPNSSTSTITNPTRIADQHDSGVIEDFQRTPSTSPRSTQSQPRSPFQLSQIPEMPFQVKRPESLAVKGHEYEELPTARQDYSNVNADGDRVDNSHHGPPMFTKLPPVSVTDTNDNFLHNSGPPVPTYRKRQNPLYNTNEHEDCIDGKSQSSGKTHGSSRGCPCLCWVLLVLAIIGGIAGLCLALYNFTVDRQETAAEGIKTAMVISSPSNRTLQELLIRLQKLEEENKELRNQVQQMQSTVTLFQEKEESFNRNVSSQIEFISTSIKNIQLLPGPPGVGNLSQCTHEKKSHGSSTSDPSTVTGTIPSAQDNQDYVILGVECTTEGGLYAHLSVFKHGQIPHSKFEEYKCTCSGKQGAEPIRYCELHYWRCPRIS